MSRAIRKGWLSYAAWRGTGHDYRRERLLLDDVERELFEEIASVSPELRKNLLELKLPWINEQTVTDDPDKLYNEVIGETETNG